MEPSEQKISESVLAWKELAAFVHKLNLETEVLMHKLDLEMRASTALDCLELDADYDQQLAEYNQWIVDLKTELGAGLAGLNLLEPDLPGPPVRFRPKLELL